MIFKLNRPKSATEGNRKEIYSVPLLPLRDIVIFPHMVVPLFIGRERSIAALEHAMGQDSYVLLCTQRDAKKDEPGENDIYRLIEKPRHPLSESQGTGHCVFRNAIYDYIQYTPIHHQRNEKELPDLIQCAIDDAMTLKAFIIGEKYTNVNTRQDIKIAKSFFHE